MDILIDEFNVVIDKGLINTNPTYIDVVSYDGSFNRYMNWPTYKIEYDVSQEVYVQAVPQENLMINRVLRLNPNYSEAQE